MEVQIREQAIFFDILEPRRTQSGIFRFMTRAWNPKKSQVLDKVHSPQDLKDIALSSLYLEALIESESVKTGILKKKLKKEIQSYIEEIGMDKKMHVIRWLGMFSLKIAFNMNIGIYVNEPAILKVRSTMGKNPLLFLPTHRSYADFCILTYLCYHYDIEFPAVASGMDFYSMAVIGQVLRETCAFYIRRTLAGAPLYAAALRQYVRTLVAKHSAPIEFFLEGTRSRSNKSLPPKYGMLSMALMPLFAREVPDVTVVPVNISYDRLMEQTTFAYEHLGVPKPKESTRGLLKWVSSLNGQFGNMYINFGEPISVMELMDTIPNTQDALKPVDLQDLSPEQFRQVQSVAEFTVTQQQKNTVATISNLMAIVLMQSLMKQKCLSYDEVLADVEWVEKVIRDLGGTVFEEDLRKNVDRILVIHAKSWALDRRRQLRLLACPDNPTPQEGKMKGHMLKAKTMSDAIPVIQLQIYVNPILHYLVPPALVYATVKSGRLNKDQIQERYHRLRKLLRHEFYHIAKEELKTFNDAFKYCLENDIIASSGDLLVEGSDTRLQFLLQWAVWPALTSMRICADVMLKHEHCEHKQALKYIQEQAESVSAAPYCLSLEAAGCCLAACTANEALRKDTRNQNIHYTLVRDVMTEYRELVNSVLPTFCVDFGANNPVILDHKEKSRL